MEDRKEFFKECVDSWEVSVKFDKRIAIQNFLVAGGGMALIGAGITCIINGNIGEGIFLTGGGGVIVRSFGKEGLEGIQDMADSKAKVAVWQERIDQLSS